MSWDAMLQVELDGCVVCMQSFGNSNYSLFDGKCLLGKAQFAFLAFLVTLQHDAQRGRRLWLLLAFGMLLNASLDFFHEMRPFVYDPMLARFSAPDTYAFPSGQRTGSDFVWHFGDGKNNLGALVILVVEVVFSWYFSIIARVYSN